jgi:hypothetical protein
VTDLAEVAGLAHAVYRQVKQDAVDRAGGPTNLIPILTVATRGTRPLLVGCPYGLLPGAVRQLTAGREPEVLTYCADAWIQTTPLESGVPFRLPEHGQLASAFRAGDMTVREVLYTVVVTRGARRLAVSTYRYDDRGRLVFDPVDETEVVAGPFGGVIDELRLAWA